MLRLVPLLGTAWLLASPAVLKSQSEAGVSKKSSSKTSQGKWTPPLTSDGEPDLAGVWINSWATPLERPKELAGRQFLTDQEVAEFRKRAQRLFQQEDSDFANGDNYYLSILSNLQVYKNPAKSTGGTEEMVPRDIEKRTALIVDPPDGRIPPLTPAGQERLDKWTTARSHPPARPQEMNNDQRCITFGVPLVGLYGSGPYSYHQIIQGRGHVVIVMESIHGVRIIPLDGSPHPPPEIRAWNGDSRGRWEKNTLVVDTTNFSPQSQFMGSAENLHLVERFTRVAPNEIEYVVTLDDPTTWTRPWTVKIRLMNSQERLYEFACHEGNEAVMKGMLAGSQAEEKAAKEAAKKSSK